MHFFLNGDRKTDMSKLELGSVKATNYQGCIFRRKILLAPMGVFAHGSPLTPAEFLLPPSAKFHDPRRLGQSLLGEKYVARKGGKK